MPCAHVTGSHCLAAEVCLQQQQQQQHRHASVCHEHSCLRKNHNQPPLLLKVSPVKSVCSIQCPRPPPPPPRFTPTPPQHDVMRARDSTNPSSAIQLAQGALAAAPAVCHLLRGMSCSSRRTQNHSPSSTMINSPLMFASHLQQQQQQYSSSSSSKSRDWWSVGTKRLCCAMAKSPREPSCTGVA
jgi:hypothetical protein